MVSFHDLLKQGPQLGLCITYPAPGIIERIGPDWDWIWIDSQHGELDYTDILAAVRACNLIRKPSLVRVPGHEAGPIGLALDTGTEALMAPLVETAEQAEAIVYAAKFPPLGSRSYGGRRPIDLFGRAYSHIDHSQPLLICQIETERGLKNASAIAAVEGVDALFFGPDDMAMRMGLPMDQPRSAQLFEKALESIALACHTYHKIAGSVFTDQASIGNAVKLGYTLIVSTADATLLAKGSSAISCLLKSTFPSTDFSTG